jgi:hypothetical protein
MAGSKALYAKWVGNALVYYTAAGLEIFRIDGSLRALSVPAASAILGSPIALRTRTAIAAVNAGATLLPAVAGYKYRLIDAYAVAIGGAATTGTTVTILGTQAASPATLVAFGQAALTQSALVRAGSAGGVILADGASFVKNDVNTAITIGITGSSFTVVTSIDTVLTYALEL